MEKLDSLSYSRSRSRSSSESPIGVELVKSKSRSKTPEVIAPVNSKSRSKTPKGIAFVSDSQYRRAQAKGTMMRKKHKKNTTNKKKPPLVPRNEMDSIVELVFARNKETMTAKQFWKVPLVVECLKDGTFDKKEILTEMKALKINPEKISKTDLKEVFARGEEE